MAVTQKPLDSLDLPTFLGRHKEASRTSSAEPVLSNVLLEDGRHRKSNERTLSRMVAASLPLRTIQRDFHQFEPERIAHVAQLG